MNRFVSLILTLCRYLFFACIIAFGIKMLKEPDVWWMLRTGEWILNHGDVVRSDVFSFSHFGVEWINVKWAFELLLYAMSLIGGPEFSPVVQCLVYFLIFLLLEKRTQLSEKPSQLLKLSSILIGLACLIAIEFRMLGRPEMISHLMLVLYLYILERHRQKKDSKIFWLIPLQIAWTNLHEAYGVGLIILLTYGLAVFMEALFAPKKYDKGLVLVCLLSILAIAINPRGIQMIWHPFEILSQVDLNKYTVELVNAADPLYWRKEAYLFLGFFIASAIVLWFRFSEINFSIKQWIGKYGLAWPALYFAFFYLGFSAYRNIPFFIFFSAPLIAVALQRIIVKLPLKKLSMAVGGIALFLFLLAFYSSIVSDKYYRYTERSDRYGLQVDPLKNPIGVGAFMKKINIQGQGFSDYLTSSYLLWDLKPNFKTFIDLRDLDVFQADFFNAFFELTGRPEKFDEFDAQYDFQYAVVFRPELMPLQVYLDRHAEWELVYGDPVATLFLKKNQNNRALIDSLNTHLSGSVFKEAASLPPSKIALAFSQLFNPFYQPDRTYEGLDQDLIAAEYFLTLSDYDAALYHCDLSVQKRGETEENLYKQGAIYLELLQKSSTNTARIEYYRQLAEKAFIRINQIKPNSSLAYKGLGILYFKLNQVETAINYFKRITEEEQDFELLSFLSEAYAQKMQTNTTPGSLLFNDFLESSLRAHELNPKNFIINYKLSIAYCQLGDCESAAAYMNMIQEDPKFNTGNYSKNIQACLSNCR